MPLVHHRWNPQCPAREATAHHAVWLRARIGSVLIDWPGIALDAVDCSADEVTLAVRARDEATARAFALAVEAELGRAIARRGGRLGMIDDR
ncbi:MAG: hypothetical protein IPP98_08440 [Gemmatimonadetes bacterium]|nr:hypothetical protein [Gemmatimonadota bacterium]MBL0179136.1 hypothetical protein [Gemmatimonadota bacterium]MBP6444636.1 hypothetical protein [Gemmatimonadales bacterium]MBP6572289.1 hypothetical protein [Gemmatimonadales bacterium]MBP7620852.1 hypothetical protein [Gemmatimonadales bacterium]